MIYYWAHILKLNSMCVLIWWWRTPDEMKLKFTNLPFLCFSPRFFRVHQWYIRQQNMFSVRRNNSYSDKKYFWFFSCFSVPIENLISWIYSMKILQMSCIEFKSVIVGLPTVLNLLWLYYNSRLAVWHESSGLCEIGVDALLCTNYENRSVLISLPSIYFYVIFNTLL